jgi:hypothetical protein
METGWHTGEPMMTIEALHWEFRPPRDDQGIRPLREVMAAFNQQLQAVLFTNETTAEDVLNVCPATSEMSFGFITDWIIFVRCD